MGSTPRLGNVSPPTTLISPQTHPVLRQFYRFIFLARSWALDRTNLSIALRDLATRARRGAGLWVLIFPEGTITSDDERAKSVRYARKEGVVSVFLLLG
jgi:1-acyl-sn-glycerol-3-phosphate acyltransferase